MSVLQPALRSIRAARTSPLLLARAALSPRLFSSGQAGNAWVDPKAMPKVGLF
jgi:hypothetical protein